MTKDDIIRMAHEAGYSHKLPTGEHGPALERFAALVAATEREACIRLCESRNMGDGSREDQEARRIASEIRARGQQ